MRLFAALGPADIVAAQRQQLSRSDIPSATSIIFSGQLFEYCRQRNIEALFTSCNPKIDELTTPSIRLINVPRSWEKSPGPRFHLGRMFYAFRLAWMARQFRADFALIDSGSAHYFALTVFRLVGMPVAVNFHHVRWPQGFEACGRISRFIRVLDSWFFRRIAIGSIGCSPECGRQARSGGADKLPYFGWCGQFTTDGFDPGNVEEARDPFRLLFAGRIERLKGVFDLISISRLLKRRCKVPVVIEICGDGGALPELRAAVESSGEADRIILRGPLARPALLKAYGRAHAVIVPTRGDFCEGMPLVCAEAVLSGRPIVTSRLSNALTVVGDAIAEAAPQDAASYAEEICRLAEDLEYYNRLRLACSGASRQFLDRSRSYPAAVDRLFAAVVPKWNTLEDYECLFESLSNAQQLV